MTNNAEREAFDTWYPSSGIENDDTSAKTAARIAWQARAQASGVLEGWQLVPIEPTAKMLRAGFLSETEHFDIERPSDAPSLVYKAMLSASPKREGE